jgi:photosystem II stability/assembly factor-like uncharacterized protein
MHHSLRRPSVFPLVLWAVLWAASAPGRPARAEGPESGRERSAARDGVEPAAGDAGREDAHADRGERVGIRENVDNPEARAAWELDVRAYPFDAPPAGAPSAAAGEYLRRRAAVRLARARRTATLGLSAAFLAPESLPTGPWSEIGPAPIDDDNPTQLTEYGRTAGRISTVALDPEDSDVILVGASRGGIWRSEDAGASWAPVSDDQPTLVIADLRFAPSDPSIVYAATGDNDVNYWGAGVLKSMDGGRSWFRVDNGSALDGIPDGTVLSKIVVDPTSAAHVVASGYRYQDPNGSNLSTSIFTTFDGGVTWTRAALPSPGGVGQFHSLVIEDGCPSRLWSIDFLNHTLIRSTDGGLGWMTVATSGLPAFLSNTKIAVRHASCEGPATLFASVNSGNGLAGSPGYPGVYRSRDDGASWELPGSVAGPSGGCLSQCRYDHELFLDPVDPDYVYMLGRDVWVSADGGATWTNRSGGYDDANTSLRGRMHADQHDAAILGAGATASLYVASDGGLWRYDLALDAFTNLNGNLAISEFVDIALDPDTPNRAIGGLQDNGTIQYLASKPWSARVFGDGSRSGYMRTSPGSDQPFDAAFSGGAGNLLSVSMDGGYTWTALASNATFPRTDSPLNEAAEIYAPWLWTPGDGRMWHGARSLWYCEFPAGCLTGSWIRHTANLALLTGSADVSKVAIHNPSAGALGPFYVANAFPRAFLQSDAGAAWNNRSAGLPDRYISSIQLGPQNPQRVWVTLQGFGSGHVFYSPDGGITWLDRSGNLPNVPANALALDPLSPDTTWYLATDSGVYGTADGGVTWTVVGEDLPAAWVNDVEIGPNRMLYAATGGRSAWRIALPGAVPAPAEVSAEIPLRVTKKPGGWISLSWEETVAASEASNIYEGALGSWYSHAPVACHLAPPMALCAAGRCAVDIVPGAGNRYYLITASGPGVEGPAGDSGWDGPDHVAEPRFAVRNPCGGI